MALLETEIPAAPSHPPATPYLTSRNSLSTVSLLPSAHRPRAISVNLSLPSQVIAFFKFDIKSILVNTVHACESSGSSSSEAVAALGGVLAVVIVTAIAVQAMVIVYFMKKLQRAEKYTATLAARLKGSFYKHSV